MRGGHTCSWWRCSQRTCTAIPRLDMKNRHTLDGLAVPSRHFQGFLDQFGSHVFRHGVANSSFRVAAPSRPAGYTNPSRVRSIWVMSPTSFRNWCICCEVPFDQVGATCQVGGRHGGAGLGAGLTRHQALLPHEPAHRLWTGCNTTHVPRFCGSVYNRWVCLESLKKYVTKMASSSRRFWVSDMPLLRQA